MKHFLVILLMSLLFSSCMKNYPEMVYEKALQYQQEGKYILGKSDDPSGKEHYIVYIDNKNIVVDDLVDSLRHYPLGNLKSFDFGLYNGDAAGNDSIDFGENESSLKCLVQADTATNTMTIEPSYEIWPLKIIAFKDIVCPNQYCAYYFDGKSSIIFFFDRPGEIYTSLNEVVTVKKNEKGFNLHFHDKGNNLGLYSLSEKLVFEKCEFNMQIADDSEILGVDDKITIGGAYSIPVSVFGTPELPAYIAKIGSALHPMYYWNCQNCGRVVKAEEKPKSSVCDFFTKSYWTFHSWIKIAVAGSSYVYQCQHCGVQIQTNDIPHTGNCPEGGQHVWRRLD